MRKLLLTIALMGPLACSAQQIVLDKQEANGERGIVTSHVIFTQNKGFLGSGVSREIFMQFNRVKHDSAYTDEYYICYPQVFLERRSLEIGRKMLLKTSSDSVIEISNAIPVSGAGNTYEIINNIAFYTVRPLYGVSSSQIRQIIDGGIKKLRIETNAGAYDLQPSDKSKFWNFSLAVKMCYDCIQKRLRYSNDLHNGF